LGTLAMRSKSSCTTGEDSKSTFIELLSPAGAWPYGD